MKTAAEFRLAAREALKGKWWLAVGVGILASILGGQSSGFNVNIELPESSEMPNASTPVDPETFANAFEQILPMILGIGAFALITGLLFGIAFFILGSVVGTGYAKFDLNLIVRRP